MLYCRFPTEPWLGRLPVVVECQSPSAKRSYRNTNVETVKAIPEGIWTMTQAKKVDPWGDGPTAQAQSEADVKSYDAGGPRYYNLLC